MNFCSAASEDYSENGLVCLTNLGDIHVFSVPALRPQVRYDCIRKEDISGIASCVFTKTGQGDKLIKTYSYFRRGVCVGVWAVIADGILSSSIDRVLSDLTFGV